MPTSLSLVVPGVVKMTTSGGTSGENVDIMTSFCVQCDIHDTSGARFRRSYLGKQKRNSKQIKYRGGGGGGDKQLTQYRVWVFRL